MPLDRRDSFCEAAGLDLCSEDPRKNFIPFSATTAVWFWVAQRFSAAIKPAFVSGFSRRGHRCDFFHSLFAPHQPGKVYEAVAAAFPGSL
jgi:hypothetical protein